MLVLLVPMYFFIGTLIPGRAVFRPEVALDRAVPLQPAWTLVYFSMWVSAFLPVFVVRQTELRRRAVLSYLSVVIVAFAVFLAYPTVAPRPTRVDGDGFLVWTLRFLYDFDPPYNCFPSLHLAYATLAALTCARVHRGLGLFAVMWTALIGMSTLYTKQHYVVDVVAGIVLAAMAHAVWFHGYARDSVLESDRRLAPRRALGAVALVGVVIGGFWAAYLLQVAA